MSRLLNTAAGSMRTDVSTATRARALLLIWSAPLVVSFVTIAVSVLCCVTPLHHIIHQDAGMQACDHDRQQMEARDADGNPFAKPSSPAQPRLEVEASPVLASPGARMVSSAGMSDRFVDTGPDGPDAPALARLAVFRI